MSQLLALHGRARPVDTMRPSIGRWSFRVIPAILALGLLSVVWDGQLPRPGTPTAAQRTGMPSSAGAAGIPDDAAAGVSIRTSHAGAVKLGLPARGAAQRSGPMTTYPGRAPGTEVDVRATRGGAQALVRLAGSRSPERYAFPIGGAAAELRRRADGSVTVLNRSGFKIGTIAAPWARDANGRAIATRFEIRGTTLVQIVEHRSHGTAYPVTADPSFWSVLKCGAAITYVVGTSVLAVSKIVRIRKLVKALGGVKDTAKLLLGATTRAEKLQAMKKAAGAAAGIGAYFLGIDTIRKYC